MVSSSVKIFALGTLLSASILFAQEPTQNLSVVPTANKVLVPTKNVAPMEQPLSVNKNKKSIKPFFEIWGMSSYFSTAYQENRPNNDYGKIIHRYQPRLGLMIPFFVEGMTLDPYIGGELVFGGDDEFYFNYIAPAVGARVKLLKAMDSRQGLADYFSDLEFYLESETRGVMNESGPHITNGPYAANHAVDPNWVFGFRNYKESFAEHLWWDQFTRFDFRTTDFQKTDYNGWLLLMNGKLGYNLMENTKERLSQPWNMGPYLKFEMFKNFVSNPSYEFYFSNRMEYGLGFQIKLNTKAENVSSAWGRIFVEYDKVSYFNLQPTGSSASDNWLIGFELWNR